MRALLLALPLLAAPLGASAHPHVFVDAEIEVVMDGAGAVTGLRLTWIYDPFFSLLLTEEQGLDPDGDAVLTEAETQALAGSVLDWPPDFAGDLTVTQGGAPVALAPREDPALAFVDGRIRESHLRPLAQPLRADTPIVVQNFDPSYYVAYAVSENVSLTGGEGCAAALSRADPEEAQAEIDAIWGDIGIADAPADVTLPPIGYAFADTIEVRCGA